MPKDQSNSISLKKYAEESYLNYAMYVILDRALPNVGDGLKPVQRRILYAMSELGLDAGSKYKKSARTVGDVIGKFHPHGDSAAYEAMVLMAQNFSFKYPLVDGQGNWGSQDDPKSFAAMRYTESKLTNFANLLISELKSGTVDWQPNFDGSLLEPVIFPAKIPMILLNGTSGIAVGMATDIPSHNINEVIDATVKILEKPKSDLKDLLKIIKGPDFSNNASIVASTEELEEMYSSGRGGFKIQAQWRQDKNQIIINALPYQTSGSKILEQIAEQMINKKLPMVVDLADEGDHEDPIRLVITLKSNRVNAEDVMNHLYASTDLQKNYRVNMNLISLKGGPKVFSLIDLLKEWVIFRKDTVKRKLEHRLDQVNDRLHILEGLLTIFVDIDKVIKIIRNSDEPKKELIKAFKLSEIQANAILEIRLRQLAKLEQLKIENERNELVDEQDDIEKILKSKSRLKTLIKNELNEIKELFGEERKSPIIDSTNAKIFSEEETIVTEPITVVLSKAGWVRSAKGHDIDPNTLSYRGDDSLQDFARGRSNQLAVFLDSNGKAYSIQSHSLPSARGMGEPITGRLNADSGVQFISSVIGVEGNKFLIMNTAGYGYISEYQNMISNKKTGRAFMKLPDNAKMLKAIPVKDNHTHIAAVSNIGKLLIFNIEELPILGKGKGNKIINIPKDKLAAGEEFMAHAQLLADDSSLKIEVGKRSVTLKPKDWSEYVLSRGKRGKKVGKLINIEKLIEEPKSLEE
ncbi:MAG: DNA topoisomerase IV subunit A [SAR86 cluster bacterium]|jgi:topoisomerase-4 subunit A|uniref:DNA topoisomerase 4 subunit A n=1 Tax=SAR86 cluster bacterium TaxID=2030880 RepID=A0A520MYA2_9GAMM|nr:MAG: DNA topoisomerase IV subunit A [SAR86 cluster bacterium]|tara:strand:+ start:230 stop:2473 length:2244 start_codon:yes stop_codon:yes gene_type:complete